MCGIVGKLNTAAPVEPGDIAAMLAPIAHRGPDATGVYLDGPCGLGHARLSIIDLGTGQQPMCNEDETVWIVFNGEIYNYQELRPRLAAKGHTFRSQSDTEVIIHAYEEYGADCVKELRGMFAFAIWDSRRQRLFIARDRVGIKPLYYSGGAGDFYFASELKAIMADASVRRDIALPAIQRFLAFQYVPGDITLFQSVKKLPPGHTLTIEDGRMEIRRYWDLQFTRGRWDVPFESAVEELRALIRETVKDHMMADVPVGVLLSGGMDSSAVLSFAVNGTAKKVKTFTVGFSGANVVDERPYAKLAARRFGTEHHDLSITADDFWNFLPAYAAHMEEPVCEPPAVALYYVSKLARGHVKVLLSGEGGDEAFAGYPNYPNMLRLERLAAAAGPMARWLGGAASVAGRISGDERVARYGHAMGRPLASHYFSRSSNPSTFFNTRNGNFFAPLFHGAPARPAPGELVADLMRGVANEPLLNQMLYIDTMTWLPDDLLVKADKITMANSLELRVPLLDHKVLEFAATLPPDFKVRGKETKRILKAAFSTVLPPEILTRKKVGFPVPYAKWLQHDLRTKVEDVLLSEESLGRGYFQPGAVKALLEANARTGKLAREVFSLLALEFWHRAFCPKTAPAAPRVPAPQSVL